MNQANFMFSTSTKKDISFASLSILLSLGLSACNGGGNGNPESSTGEAPIVTLSSPTFDSATTNSVFAVSGTASDADSSVSLVTVNGVEAQSNDGFNNWLALIPLDNSIDSIEISAEDTEGNTTEQSFNIRLNKLDAIFSQPTELTLDTQNQQLIITDKSQGKIYRSALSNPNLSSVALNTNGDQITLNAPSKTILDKSVNEALLLDIAVTARSSSNSIYSIDTQTGDTKNKVDLSTIAGISNVIDMAASPDGKTLYFLSELENSRSGGAIVSYSLSAQTAAMLSTTEAHSDPDATAPSTLSINNNGSTLYYIDNNALVSVNTSTSSTSTVSERIESIALSNPKDLIVDTLLNKAWVADLALSAIIEINLNDGSRRIVSDASTGTGPLLQSPDKLAFDKANSRLLVADQHFGLILSIEIASGNREYYISNRFGYGPALQTPADIVIDSSKNLAYVADNALGAILSIDLDNGNRQLISSNDESASQGNNFLEISQLSLDTTSETLWASDNGLGKIIEVNLSNGQRTTINPSYNTGSEVIQKPTGLAFNEQANALFISDIFNDSVQSLSLSEHLVSMVGSNILSDATKIDKPISIALDTTTNKTYAIDSLMKALIEWDPASNSSKVLSKLFIGQGINFSKPSDIQIDSSTSKAYISDKALNAIFVVDLSTGDRKILSGNATGTGPEFLSVGGIAINHTNDSLLVTDPKGKAVISVNLNDGSRQIIAR
jgi:Glucodextranase, domain B